MGFRHVASGPLVRSSYRAAEAFIASELGRAPAAAPPVGDPGLVPASSLVRR